MQPHFLKFIPSLEEFKEKISWDLLDDELKVSAMSFYDKYNHSNGPVASWKLLKAEKKDGICILGNRSFSGKVFSMIEDGQTVAVYVASCGILDNTNYTDPLESFFSETLKRQACDMALKYCIDEVSKLLGGHVCSINPGSGNSDMWPVEELKNLFGLLEEEILPVKILQSGLMYPVKSVAGILFPSDSNFRSCRFCSREECPDRRLD